MSNSASHAPKRVRLSTQPMMTLDNACDVQDSYVRTRHNNLRCFPKCSPVHKTKSFCGVPLHITLHNCSLQDKMLLVAEFRNASGPTSLRVGELCDKHMLDAQKHILFQGVVASSDGGNCQLAKTKWILNPPRKWRYEGRTSALDFHVLTMYIVHDDRVIAMLDSPQFRVVPIWRTSDETSPQAKAQPMASIAAVDALASLSKPAGTFEISEEQRAMAACLGLKPPPSSFSLYTPPTPPMLQPNLLFPMASRFPSFTSLFAPDANPSTSLQVPVLMPRFPVMPPHLASLPSFVKPAQL